jgi:hypothetical protein
VTATDFSIIATGNQVTVTPVINYVSPPYANPTNLVRINGSGFAASSNLTVKLGSVTVTPSVTSSDISGHVGALTFNVPSDTVAGATTITVTDSASPPNSASIAFTVYNATISLSPTTVSRGESVTLTGSGWPPFNGGGILVSIGPSVLCNVFPDASGVISASCTVPSSMPTGTANVMATDGSIIATGNQVTVN